MSDVTKSLVLFVDLQEGLLEASRTQLPSDIRRNASSLLSIAKVLGLAHAASVVPMVPSTPPLIAELSDVEPKLNVVRRKTISAFKSIAEPLDRLILCGVVAEAAVLHTALEARRAGCAVDVLLDACGGLSARTEDAAIRQMESAGIRTSSVASFATGCIDDMTDPSAGAVMRLLRQMII